MPGFPIRTPWDHSLVDSSPRPIAASHVLHRLLVPRHPPFALDNLTTKMLASTVQFSNNNQPPHHPSTRPTPTRAQYRAKHGIDPKTQTTPTSGVCLFLQDPTGCSSPYRAVPPTVPHPRGKPRSSTRPDRPLPDPTRQCLRHVSTPHQHSWRAGSWTHYRPGAP